MYSQPCQQNKEDSEFSLSLLCVLIYKSHEDEYKIGSTSLATFTVYMNNILRPIFHPKMNKGSFITQDMFRKLKSFTQNKFLDF